jgi:hypothetical protein
MKNSALAIAAGVVTILLVAAGQLNAGRARPTTPEGAVQAMFSQVKARDWNDAMDYVSKSSGVTATDLKRDLGGTNASLKTYASIQNVDTSVLHQNDNEGMIRTRLEYSSAVGALSDTRDVKVIKEDNAWKVVWPVQKQAKVPPQVIPVNYLRWDIVTRGSDDDWGAQNVEPPKVRVITMNAVERDGGLTILGEMENEDTVPGFAAVSATIVGQNGETLGEEGAFDKMNHVILPKEVTPFRIDFPGIKRSQVKTVTMHPYALLVEASADPVIGVLHQRIEKDSAGHPVLKGELVNQSGETVNIPHVIATFYDNSSKVVWVADGYVMNALLPNTPEPFAVSIPNDLAANVTYRVIPNQYSIPRAGM